MTREKSYAECKELAAKYSTAGELRDLDKNLYMRIWRMKFWDLLPPGKNAPSYKRNELSLLSDEELIEMSRQYSSKSELTKKNFMLYRQMAVRGLQDEMPSGFSVRGSKKWSEETLIEHFEKMAYKTRSEAAAKSRSACDAAVRLGLDHLLPERVRKKTKEEEAEEPSGKVYGIMECWRAKSEVRGDMFACGRCERELALSKRMSNIRCLCRDCGNMYCGAVAKGELPDSLNVKNIKAIYCNISIRLDSGERIYVGLEADADLKKRLVAEGYSFILKGL